MQGLGASGVLSGSPGVLGNCGRDRGSCALLTSSKSGKMQCGPAHGQPRMKTPLGEITPDLSSLIICISEVIDISLSNLDSSLCFFQSSVSHDVLCIEVK